jgi:predicted dinucleotide-binding enzyme
MDIGVFGINTFAMTFCKHWIQAGHKILYADLPGRLENYHKISKLGPGVSVTTPGQIALLAEIIVLAIDYGDLKESIKSMGPIRQKIVVDLVAATATPFHWNSFFEIQKQLPEVKVVKLTHDYPLHHSTQSEQVIFSYCNDQLAQRMVRWSIEGSGYQMIEVNDWNQTAADRKVN